MEIFFFSTFGRAFIPKRMRPHLRYFFEKTGMDEVPEYGFGIIFWVSVLLTYFIYIIQIFPNIRGQNTILFGIVTLVLWSAIMLILISLIAGVVYFFLTVRIYKRTKEMELKLPDYLTLVSTGLRGGYSFEKSLWAAIRPEFGVLAQEIGLVSKRVLTGSDVGQSMTDFSLKYESPILRRALNLIIGELESGGRIVDVIDRVIVNLKKAQNLKAELAASTLTYMMFISALVMFVMPLLFALSFVLFNIISGFVGTLTTSMASSSMSSFQINKPSVDIDDYRLFTVMAITIISSSSALIISIIEKGDIRGGIKYLPIFLISSLFFYFVFLAVFGGLFGGLIPS